MTNPVSTESGLPARPDAPAGSSGGGLLDLVERIGNRLPDPTTLFLLGLGLVMVVSWLAATGNWQVVARLPEVRMVDGTQVLDAAGDPVVDWVETGQVLEARNLLSRDGLYWLFDTLVDNFIGFAPLGVVLVGMLGIGIAEGPASSRPCSRPSCWWCPRGCSRRRWCSSAS